jgi:hypothetical protein
MNEIAIFHSRVFIYRGADAWAIALQKPPSFLANALTEGSGRTANAGPCLMSGSWGRLGDRLISAHHARLSQLQTLDFGGKVDG